MLKEHGAISVVPIFVLQVDIPVSVLEQLRADRFESRYADPIIPNRFRIEGSHNRRCPYPC